MKDRKDWLGDLVEEVFLPADLRCIIKVHFPSLYSASDFLLCIFILYSTDLISGGGGALCLRSFQACFPRPNLPPLFPIFHTGKQNFAKSPGEKNISNIKVSYYDKLLDACEHVAVKRGRAPLIREVFSHSNTCVCGSVLMLLR